jgi:alanine racemase
MSHLAEAETPESSANREQESRFDGVLAELGPGERQRVAVHFGNSAGALYQPGKRHDLVRLGLALFGLDPARPRASGELEPVLSLAAEIVQTKPVATGARVGYGGRWVAERPSRLAIVPLGYADGYSWRLSNRAEAIVRGIRVPVAGAVSMDMLAIDVTDAGGEVGDEVVLVGRRGDVEVSVAELAAAVGTLPYELLCLFGLRLPRVVARGVAPGVAAASDRPREASALR